MEETQKPKIAYYVSIRRTISWEFDLEKGYDLEFVQGFVRGVVSALKKDYQVPKPGLPVAQARGERIGQFLKVHAQRWNIPRGRLLELTVTFQGVAQDWTDFLDDRRGSKYRQGRAAIS
jgi:hypothetical protein